MKIILRNLIIITGVFLLFTACDPREETSAPVACFNPSMTEANVNQVINFSSECSQDAVSFGWNFGDGTTSNSENPNHSYSVPGEYEVKLKVYNRNLNDETSMTINIVSAQEPEACFTMSATQIAPGENVTFSNCSANGTEYYWNFGDGETSEAFEPVHSYAAVGDYTVTLTVYNGSLSDVITKNISVTEGSQIDPRVYSSITQWDEHYYTDFSNEGGFWIGEDPDGQYTCSLDNGFYKVEVPDTNYNWIFTNGIAEIPAESQNYEIELVVTMDRDDSWSGSGMAWAKSDDPFQFIYYVIDINGWYLIGDNVVGSWMTDWKQEGQEITNKITVRKYGNKYFFFINEIFVEEFDFKPYFGKQFCIRAGSNSTTRFDEYGIWTTSQTAPSKIVKPKERIPVKTKSSGFIAPVKAKRQIR